MLIEQELERHLSAFTKSDIANHVGISRPTLNKKLEDTSTFTLGEWTCLCDLIGLPVALFLPDKEPKSYVPKRLQSRQVIFELFLVEKCELSKKDFTPAPMLHEFYTDFCHDFEQSYVFTRRELAYRMTLKGFTSTKRRYEGIPVSCWDNIQLKKDFVPLPEDEGEIIFG